MRFFITAHTDIGIRKKTNQDSLAVMKASTENGEVIFAVLCDGMGGLAKGEVASASVIEAYVKWFENDFPHYVSDGFEKEALFKDWDNIAYQMNTKIGAYGAENSISLGTTLVTLLIYQEKYYIINIGDSRVYKFDQRTNVITKDHTFVQRELDLGRLTPEEAKNHTKRNVLLQCIGASSVIQSDFYDGKVSSGEVYLLCSDGFRHIITEDEMFAQLNPGFHHSPESLNKAAVYLTDLNKYRRENDNISVVLIKSE